MQKRFRSATLVLLAFSGLGLWPADAPAQDRLRSMPGHERYQEIRPQIAGSFTSGALRVTWAEDGASFEYAYDGRLYRYTVATGEVELLPGDPPAPQGRFRRPAGFPARGRQFESAASPDSSMNAFYRDRNLFISDMDGSNEIVVTTEGSEAERTKFGTGSWVYGEELNQITAMWWSPDGSKLAYYGFDESPVQDYYLQMDQAQIQSSLDTEAYPKAGTDNPVVTLFVYDLASRTSTEIDVRDGQPFTNDVVGHYVYNVSWSPDGSELLLHRTNRRQNIMEFTACDPVTGGCRVIIREEWPTGWVQNRPAMQYLEDDYRFIWTSERTGWRNLYLYDLSGALLTTLTHHEFEVASIVDVDEDAGVFWYMARDGDNHMKMQLHRVGLDGRGDVRLTDPAYNHTVTLAPDGMHFVDVAQTHHRPPFTQLVDATGHVVSRVVESDLTEFEALGLTQVEMFTFTAADGVTELHGMLHKPSNFDPNRSYPVLASVYAGPATNGARETFTLPNALTEYGFLVVTLDTRSAGGKGKRALDAIYEKLGVVEIDDLASGIRSLWDRPYVDRDNVGIFGTSYGGYASAMAILRHPDVFHAAVASSAVTDWRHYDTIYTERYMWIPQENTDGYDAGSAMQYAEDLEGDLMIYYGTADNNVHPSNSMQLIHALQREGKSFEVQVGPDRGHTALNRDRMMEFFIESLVLDWPLGGGS